MKAQIFLKNRDEPFFQISIQNLSNSTFKSVQSRATYNKVPFSSGNKSKSYIHKCTKFFRILGQGCISYSLRIYQHIGHSQSLAFTINCQSGPHKLWYFYGHGLFSPRQNAWVSEWAQANAPSLNKKGIVSGNQATCHFLFIKKLWPILVYGIGRFDSTRVWSWLTQLTLF